MTNEELITREVMKLEKAGYWTRIVRLNFDKELYPIARIEYGQIMSNGLHEMALGFISVWENGQVDKLVHGG